MQDFLAHWVTQSLAFSLTAVALVAFLESLAFVGLLLPGTLMMATLGAFIGSGTLGFYPAWAAGIVGCFLGDWISYFIGHGCKKSLKKWSFLKKHRAMLHKTEHALHRHSNLTILAGRFIGPTRPLIPLVAGMLDLPPLKFALPNIIGCLSWPPAYFMPGILAGVAINIPAGQHTGQFRGLLLGVALLVWLAGWLVWRWFRSGKRTTGRLAGWLPLSRLRWLAPLCLMAAVAALIALIQHPLMPIYAAQLWKVLKF
ncbi:DedA family protein [Acerihabitans arboris]|uniref:DedA family protein n=1 Tax=Acerihabitans arboris TaxID=2691583 RepID=A0A845SD42_9GAMM|nr:DedA family protein [Acerihabitans arboris]NDL61312.1 DedA family protein [Acerihabitans arboris]